MSANAATTTPGKAPRPDLIAEALRVIVEPGQVWEVRILDAVTAATRRPHTESGYFNDGDAAARAVAGVGKAKGYYFTPNPVNPALLARAVNRLRPMFDRDPLTSDTDVTARRFLLVDVDPVRPQGISASDSEHEAALAKVRQIKNDLAAEGWPVPILADSGNGGHLLYRVDLPADDGGLVTRVLEALAFWYSDRTVAVDLKVANPARIWKMYGTFGCKGDDTPERPHRLAQLLEVPPALEVVPVSVLEAFARSIPSGAELRPAKPGDSRETFDLDRWIAERCPDLIGPSPWRGGQRWVFRVCPWNPDHQNRSAYIVQHPGGAIAAGCHHNGCAGNNWHALRDLLEPGWRERRYEAPRHETPRAPASKNGATAAPLRNAPAAPPAAMSPAGGTSCRYVLHAAAEAFLPLPERTEIVAGLITLPSLTVPYGPPGGGKTWLMMDLALAIATGQPWLGIPTKKSAVVWIDEESGLHRFLRRLRQLLDGRGISEAPPLAFTSLEQFNLRDSADVGYLDDIVEQTGAVAVFIDAAVDVAPGADENLVKDMQPLLQGLRALSERRCVAVFLIHHSGKAGSYRGSSAISGAADLMLEIVAADADPNSPDVRRVNLSVEKARDVEQPKKFSAEIAFGILKVEVRAAGAATAPRLTRAERYVVSFLEKAPGLRAGLRAMKERADTCSPRTAEDAVYKLAARGILHRADAGGRGVEAEYELTTPMSSREVPVFPCAISTHGNETGFTRPVEPVHGYFTGSTGSTGTTPGTPPTPECLAAAERPIRVATAGLEVDAELYSALLRAGVPQPEAATRARRATHVRDVPEPATEIFTGGGPAEGGAIPW